MRALFLKHLAQLSPEPLSIEIEKAEGCYLYQPDGKKYLDLIGGINVANIGHCNAEVVNAIQQQSNKYLHIMVYGELIQSAQVQYATLLTQHLPSTLNVVYFTNSGSEATEGAMKLAKRYTGKSKIIACKNSYHGSTQGALSLMGNEYWQQAFRPLLPHIYNIEYNHLPDLETIDEDTACVIIEPVQAEVGINLPSKEWLYSLQKKCTETNTLLIVDEIQTAFGRCGTLWNFEQVGIKPDILLLGKALGGGMPMGAFIASKKIMSSLSFNPVLGHITTFGGHPVCCAAGMAAFQFLLSQKLISTIEKKKNLFLQNLKHPAIQKITYCGLWFAIHFENPEICQKVIKQCIKNGLFTDWFLFAPQAMRIAPPLIITPTQITEAVEGVLKSINQVVRK